MQIYSSVSGSVTAPAPGARSSFRTKESLRNPGEFLAVLERFRSARVGLEAGELVSERDSRALAFPPSAGLPTENLRGGREAESVFCEPVSASRPEQERFGSGELGESGAHSLLAAIDPLALQLVSALPLGATETPALGREPLALEPALLDLVRRIAWSGDRRRGTLRLELGGGQLAGTAVLLESDGSGVHLAFSAPPGVDATELGARVRSRLERRGIEVRSLEIG